LLKNVRSVDDARALTVGDFIEFEASFRPDELISILDVFNPELIAAIVLWARRRSFLNAIRESTDEQETNRIAIDYQNRPQIDAEIAKAIAEAIRVDFRSAATRQYYGSIGDAGPTAVVVCDTRNFLVEDADRMLDGHFSVLGKVSTPAEDNVPILSRNKVLDRIQPGAVDLALAQLRSAAASPLEGGNSFLSKADSTLEDLIDLDFPSRIAGESFKVIPIAIYV
jgi:hypothetical protein